MGGERRNGKRKPGRYLVFLAGVTHVPAEPGEEEDEEDEEAGEVDRLRAQLGAALTEMENMKAVAEVSESTKAEAVAAVQRQCREEVASLQTILKDSISSYEARISSLEQERRQEQQVREARDRELSRLKQLLTRSHPLDSLEKQMEKAHEDSEKLREIVLPMEQEIAELKGKLLRAEELIQEIRRGEGSLRPRRHSLHGSAESLPLPRDPSPPLEQPEDLGGDGGVAAEAFARNCGDSASLSSFSFSLGGPGSSASLPRGQRGLSPEQEETASLVSTGTLVPEGIYLPPSGYQLVPDHQWEQLQLEGRQQQESVQQLQSQLESAGRERDGLQEALNRSNEDCARQVQVLLDQIQNSERLLQSLQGTVSQAQERAQQQMAELAASHKRLCYEVKRLNEENEGLRGGRPTLLGPQGQEQEDQEPPPNSVPELQRLLKEAQQELRGSRRAQEHEAERLRIEIVNLREALDEQTAARARLEGTLRGQREETREGAGGFPVQPEDGDGAHPAGAEEGGGAAARRGPEGPAPAAADAGPGLGQREGPAAELPLRAKGKGAMAAGRTGDERASAARFCEVVPGLAGAPGEDPPGRKPGAGAEHRG
uniref:Rab GTPase-binding effector protein 2 n=1 Tax=Ornithorhynchus anatinus TaxID=9258 RepID=A0A6I8NML8_ORNAN